MKHLNQILPTICSKYHLNTRKLYFPIWRFVSMLWICEIMTKFCVFSAKFMKLSGEWFVLTSQFDVSKQQIQLRSVIQIYFDQCANCGPLPLNVCVRTNHNVAFNCKKTLKVTSNTTNGDKHTNEASKQLFANYLFKISCNNTQGMISNWKICFNAFNIRNCDQICAFWKQLMKWSSEWFILTSQFDVS